MAMPLTLQLNLWGKNSNNYGQFDYYKKKHTQLRSAFEFGGSAPNKSNAIERFEL